MWSGVGIWLSLPRKQKRPSHSPPVRDKAIFVSIVIVFNSHIPWLFSAGLIFVCLAFFVFFVFFQKHGLHKVILSFKFSLDSVGGGGTCDDRVEPLLWFWIWGVDSEKLCPFYLYFSFQSLKNHTEINQMPFGDAERSDSNTNIFRRNMGNVKNCQLSIFWW